MCFGKRDPSLVLVVNFQSIATALHRQATAPQDHQDPQEVKVRTESQDPQETRENEAMMAFLFLAGEEQADV